MRARATLAVLALASAIAVWPILISQSVPAFQQDWTWPLSRGLAGTWLRAFAGLWDERSLGQANALPWQTYAVCVQAIAIWLFGSATGLAVWIAAMLFAAACGTIWMLRGFGVRTPAALLAALFYAFGPVAFTRIAAGHLAYVAAYALLPYAIALARAAVERTRASTAVALGAVAGAAGCQIQFLAIAWLAIFALPLVVPRARGWAWRLLAAALLSLAVQLQALLPLAASSTAALYAAQPALRSFEYNNSSPLAAAPVALGYFTQYYESHALAGAFAALYVLTLAALLGALWVSRRGGAYAIGLVVAGAALTAGLYGPLAVPLSWAFARVPGFAIFRDLHYFAALTALGTAFAIGLCVQRVLWPVVAAAAVLVAWAIAPSFAAGELRELIVPRADVADALGDMETAARNGPGRVLWLPAEEPLGLAGASASGRDFTAYGPPGNPSVSDDYQNPQLAYAIATLRMGRPDWHALAALDIRYFVVRRYVTSHRRMNFGTGFPMSFDGESDAAIGELLRSASQLTRLRDSARSTLYAFAGADGVRYPATVRPNAALYSQLGAREVTVADRWPAPFPASRLTADPREAWVGGALGWRFRPWLPDSIAPFVWTLSDRPLSVDVPPVLRCLLGAALPRGATLRSGASETTLRGTWRRYALGRGAQFTVAPSSQDLTAIAPCPGPAPFGPQAFVFASAFDAGWRAHVDGRWLAPSLANGWAMAWPPGAARARIAYVPSLLQLAGVLLTVLAFAGAWLIARRLDRRRA